MEQEEKENKEAAAKGQGWRISINACGHGEGGGKSAGVAVGCKKHMGMAESFADEELPDELRGRFTVKHIGAVCRGGLHVASAYLYSSLGSSISSTSTSYTPLRECYLHSKGRGSWQRTLSVRRHSWRQLAG